MKPNRARDRARRSSPVAPIPFRPDIQGLRAVAVLLVVLDHAGVPFLAGGFAGVDVFFAISGFLITTLLLKELQAKGSISIKGFYARRATRLLPASALVLVATLVAAWLWLPLTRIASIAGDALAASFYVINYRLAYVGTDYLNADAPPSPMQHFWSLAVEEQFYFVWPVMLLGTALLGRRFVGHRVAVTAALLAVLAGSLALSIHYTPTAMSWSYFGIHTRAWELAAGALVAVFPTRISRLPAWSGLMAGWLGMAMIMAAALWFSEDTLFPGRAAILPVAGTLLVIIGGYVVLDRGLHRVLNRRPLQFVGMVSYSFYLWHWPVLLIAPIAFDVRPGLAFNLAAVTGALAITWISYRFVENPIRHRKSLKLKPWRGITMGASLATVTAMIAVAGAWIVPLTVYQGAPGRDTNTAMSGPDANVQTLRDLIVAAGGKNVVPSNLTPALADAQSDRPVIYNDKCNLDITDSQTRNKICEYGDTHSSTTVVLLGDSHAAQWFPALNQIAEARGWKLVPLTRSGCAVASVDIVHKVLQRRYTECVDWRRNALDIIKELKPALVVTTSINGQVPVGPDDQPLAHSDHVMAKGWKSTFKALLRRATKVAYLIDTPNFGRPVPDCVAAHLKQLNACAVKQDHAMLRPIRTKLIRKVAKKTGVTVVNPLPWFCVDNRCPVVVGNTLVIRDSNHVTTSYIKILTPLLEARLPKL